MAVVLDTVRPLKLECPAEGGSQLDMGPTEANPHQDAFLAPAVYFQEPTASGVDKVVSVGRSAAQLTLVDATTSHVLGELVSSTAGQVGSHNALLDVIHFLTDGPGDGWASAAVSVDSYAGPLLSSTIWYADNTLAKKIVGYSYTYSGPLIATSKVTLYAADGSTIVRTVTDTYTYSGPLRTQRTRVWGVA